MTDIAPNPASDTSSVMRCYVLLALGTPMTFAPLGLASSIGLALVIFGMIWAYRLRRRDDAIIHAHARWMVRTFWFSSLLFLIGMMLSSSVISANGDHSSIDGVAQALQDGSATPEEIAAMVNAFSLANQTLILWATIVCIAPAIIYAMTRYIKGYRAADAGKSVDNVISWTV